MLLPPTSFFFGQENEAQEHAIAELRSLGARVEVDDTAPGRPVRSVDLADIYPNDTDLEHLKVFSKLQTLDLGSSEGTTDDGLERLQGLTSLRTLSLLATRITDDGLKYLKGMRDLRTLSLKWVKINGAGLAHLKGLTNLQSLDLAFTGVSDGGLGNLAGLTSLRTLDLESTDITDEGLVRRDRVRRVRRDSRRRDRPKGQCSQTCFTQQVAEKPVLTRDCFLRNLLAIRGLRTLSLRSRMALN